MRSKRIIANNFLFTFTVIKTYYENGTNTNTTTLFEKGLQYLSRVRIFNSIQIYWLKVQRHIKYKGVYLQFDLLEFYIL